MGNIFNANSYRTLSLLLIAIVLCGGCMQAETANRSDNRPNILVVLTDDQSVPHVGCYNNPDIKTPNLDRLASQGMRFDRMYVSAPQCVPARATIMTGQSSVRTNMTRFSAPLAESIITFPELLRKNGYFTGVAGRVYHLDGHNIIGSEVSKRVFKEHDLITFPRRLDFVKIADGGVGHIDQMVEFLDAAPKDKPWFLELSFDDPHRPLDTEGFENPHDPTTLTLPPFLPDTKLVREDFAHYYDEIGRFDTDFGKIMKILEKRGLIKNTLIMFMGDNGGAVLRGKGTLYEWGLHVPMIIRWDGVVKPGTSTDALICSEDLGPTFLDIAGVEPTEDMEGPSFLPVLQGKPFKGRKFICAARGAHGYNLPLNTADFDLSRSVFTKRYKLIYNPLWQLPFTPVDVFGQPFWLELKTMHELGTLPEKYSRLYFEKERPIFELYDLKNDPYEMNNLIALEEYADIEKELKETLEEWMILQHDYVPMPIPDFNPFLQR